MRRRPQVKHQPIADGLRALPGQWAEVGNYRWASAAKSTAHGIRNGILPAYQPAGSFETQIHRDSEGDAHVFARYIGTQEAAA